MPRFGLERWLRRAIVRRRLVARSVDTGVSIAIASDWRDVAMVFASISFQSVPASVHTDLPKHLRHFPLAVVNAHIAHEGDVGEGIELRDLATVAVIGTSCVNAWAGVGVDDDREGQLRVLFNAGRELVCNVGTKRSATWPGHRETRRTVVQLSARKGKRRRTALAAIQI